MLRKSIFEGTRMVKKGDVLVSLESEFNLTKGKTYVATSNQGQNTFFDCVFIVNDEGIEEDYSTELFAFAKEPIKEGDLLINTEASISLTKGRIYVSKSNEGGNEYPNGIIVENDRGEEKEYQADSFVPYRGELVK